MSNPSKYEFLNYIDAPKRILTLTIDEMVVAITDVLLLIVSNQKILVFIFGFVLFALLRITKKGEGPRALLVQMYWYLPSALTRYFLPTLPPSHYRVWLAYGEKDEF